MYRFFLSFVVALCLSTRWAVAASTTEIANSLNELAHQGFAAKELVLVVNSTADAGPIPDIYTEIDTMVTVVLTNVKFMTNTPIITDQAEEQDVYEGYSNFVQSLLELMDALSSSAAQLKSINQTTKNRVPSEIRILQTAVDVSFMINSLLRPELVADKMLTPRKAYFYNIIGLFPANSSYNAQANNQKSQVDTHCFQAIWAFDLSYSNGSQATTHQARSNSSLHSRWMKRGSL
ncbi:hypothetical protein E8E15_008934 [Penicillium rubens]|uniref:Cell wall galactomannoprotein n=1 Tax=Penicillium chrysogenum TaxID=5076 RepID=A0A167TYT0_PENCH|nr:uncharacterized protein N7489_001284 [Penicillium chrysogenum]XP_061068594.1 uncharacterized protein N7525_007637 [Penicillium rubens]KAF3027771.1 hypothetical protein E8E15_008934 [Penicillium rubens]KAJ5049141.1 hypothetical protein NUH16_007655 [Penicillium rubens]KAJ5250874.1 hypothetical protein N7489_001284 [Penicillium chrysogenum]KAJ5262308.1 hypothetical protein N7524_007613 [Penicillium chrysogenum]KAJ5269772.1 hypothetical protein N7505_005530 [Penicillium chrysogenum]